MKQQLLKFLYSFLAFCARVYLWRTKPFVIGITGSVGKTCCRDVITQVLKQVQDYELNSPRKDKKQVKKLRIYTSPKNYNSELWLVFSIFGIENYNPGIKNLLKLTLEIFKKSLFSKKCYDILVAEYGIDSSGNMDFLLTIMQPDIWILTKLDSVHSDNFHRGINELWEDKWKLLLASKQKVFFNAQDDFSLAHQDLLSKPYETTFTKNRKPWLLKDSHWIAQSFIYNKKNISINLLWNENIEYTILGLKISEILWMKLSEKSYDFSYKLQPGRFGIFEKDENIFIDSTYNAGPESMKKIIENTQLIQAELYPNHKIIYVLWDMREIGDVLQQSHENLVELVRWAQAIFTVGPYMYEYMIPELVTSWFIWEQHSGLSSREIGLKVRKYLRDNNSEKYIVLFKGSQNTIFTEEALAKQLSITQQKNLPRQTKDWKQKKDNFFKSL